MHLDELQRVCVALAIGDNRRLEDDSATEDVHDREGMRVAVRIDTHDVVQLICEHPYLTSSLVVGGHNGVGLGWKPRRQNCDGSRAQNADRLLIRPASGRQADTGLSARTHHWKDTQRGVIRESSHKQRAPTPT